MTYHYAGGHRFKIDGKYRLACVDCGMPYETWMQYANPCKADHRSELAMNAKPRRDQMNYSAAIFLVSDKVRAVKVQYQSEENAKRYQESMGYTFKTMDPNVKKGDIVTIPTTTRHHFTCAKVIETDVLIDDNASFEYKWIVGVVDVASYEAILDMETKIVEKVRAVQVQKQRRELRAGLDDLAGAEELLALVDGSKAADPVPTGTSQSGVEPPSASQAYPKPNQSAT